MKQALTALAAITLAISAWAQEDEQKGQERIEDLPGMSIEELMQIEITSVAKGEQKLLTAPAAISVIRQEDIKRTGATSIPEALRMIPGINVAKLDANKWSVSSRGFNGLFTNKLLVLIDGRTVYSPLFSGVFWAVQDTTLEDIERIEVIRGPGATVWGANAVNGVINIITKDASDTQGAYLGAAAGNEERFLGAARWGGKIDDDTSYRVYAKYSLRDEGKDGEDDWWMGRAGFRLDHSPGENDHFTLQGDYYESELGNTLTAPAPVPVFLRTYDFESPLSGGNVLARWTRDFSEDRQLMAQLYYDRTDLDYEDVLAEKRDTIDLELQYRFDAGWGQTVTIGGGYRWMQDSLSSTFLVSTPNEHRTDQITSAFIQDEIALIEDQLTLTLGSKFEYNSYTGFEYQPGVRLSLQVDERNALWASATRAIRSPSRIEDEFQFVQAVSPVPGPVTTFTVFGDEDFKSEELLAFELGYRVLPVDEVSIDVATFFNKYDDLRSTEFGAFVPGGGGPNLQPLFFDNKMEGTSYGFELAATWDVMPEWRLFAGYSHVRINLDPDNDSTAVGGEGEEGQSPRNQVYLRSSLDLPYDMQLDVMGRYVDVVPDWNVDSYIEVDVRLGWQATKNLEIAVVGQNLWHDDHLEAMDPQFNFASTEVERGFYVSASLKF